MHILHVYVNLGQKKQKRNLKLNQQSTVTTAHMHVHITVHNSLIQHSTEQF